MPRRYLPPVKQRDVGYLKPERFKEHVTIAELGRIVGKDISWLRKLERRGTIPAAVRVKRGELEVRLWSPAQIEEIKAIFQNMKIGRPSSHA